LKQTYRFGEFELDLDAQQLLLRGQAVRLERRPLDLLMLLVRRHGCMVPREEIIASLWPGNVIIDFDSGINALVRKVRKALNDSSGEPRFIETVPGRGYRFIAQVTTLALSNSNPAQPATVALPLHWRPITLVILLLLSAGSAIFVWQSYFVESRQIRVAVLPFENLTGDDALSYLASGIAEDTSTSLTQINLPNLSVIGIVSSNALAMSIESLQQVGKDLSVDLFVLSSLRLEGSHIRVTSRLIRVADSEQIWSASFDRELTNVLGLQRELSIAIAEQIRQKLSPEIKAAIGRRQTRNPEAYELYLKGRFEWTRFQPDSVQRALQFYRQAVSEDPGYALAWAGIAHALITSPVTAEADRASIVPDSQYALDQALEFGSELAETQLALGSFHFFIDQDMHSAETAARRAVALDPNSAMSHMFLGVLQSQRGYFLEARNMMQRARELDPLFPLMFANSAMVALYASEPQEALEFATQAVAINPEFWVGHLHLGGAQLALGNYGAALQAFTDAEKYSGKNSARASSSRAFTLAKLGRIGEARNVLEELISLSSERFVPPYYIAVAYAGLDEVDSAFEWLERALANRSLWCSSLAADPMLATLRTDRRFESLMAQCGFTPGI